VPDEHIYIDDEVSAVDWAKRHAWERLTDNLRRFGALLVWEQSRIGRDAQALVALERIEDADVKV
jgi:DNA invertase Pin-like site-specific DNA recombinase